MLRRPPAWTEPDDHFLRNHVGRMPLAEVARLMGRKELDLVMRCRKLRLDIALIFKERQAPND